MRTPGRRATDGDFADYLWAIVRFKNNTQSYHSCCLETTRAKEDDRNRRTREGNVLFYELLVQIKIYKELGLEVREEARWSVGQRQSSSCRRRTTREEDSLTCSSPFPPRNPSPAVIFVLPQQVYIVKRICKFSKVIVIPGLFLLQSFCNFIHTSFTVTRTAAQFRNRPP